MSNDRYNKFKHNVLKPFAGNKTTKITPAKRVVGAMVGAIASAGAGILLRKKILSVLKKNPRAFVDAMGELNFKGRILKNYNKPIFNPMSIAKDTAIGTAFGLIGGDIKNAIVKKNQKEIDENLNQHTENRKNILNNFAKTSSFIDKEAFWGGLARGAWTGIKSIRYGLHGANKMGNPLSHRVFGTAVKGGALAGAGFGGHAIYKKIKSANNPRSGEYTTFLRNNMLSGNIKSEELALPDMESVRSLGMQ